MEYEYLPSLPRICTVLCTRGRKQPCHEISKALVRAVLARNGILGSDLRGRAIGDAVLCCEKTFDHENKVRYTC